MLTPLRPNIKRLMAGEERIVGVRAWWRKRKARQRHKAAQQQRQQSSTTNTVPSNGLKHSSHP
ncbi:MAG: hypothetical protein GXO56_08465 [Chloroflexi bacterium]|nr:hypothetical protein [Chloroflexota bacterium]